MALKTPEQVADDLGIDWESSYTPSRDDVIRAIETDRAQRPAFPDPQQAAAATFLAVMGYDYSSKRRLSAIETLVYSTALSGALRAQRVAP